MQATRVACCSRSNVGGGHAHALRKMVFVQYALASYPHRCITTEAFVDLCTRSTHTPSHWRMTHAEAEQYLHALCCASRVVRVDGTRYYVDAADVVDVVHLRTGLPPLPRVAPPQAQQRDALAARVCAAHAARAVYRQRCAHQQQRRWSVIALASALQTLLLAYYTFCVYDWEVMESVCYFITTATALCALAYVTHVRCAASYRGIDEHRARCALSRMLPGTARQLTRATRDTTHLTRIDAVLHTRAQRHRAALLCIASSTSTSDTTSQT